MLKIVQDAADGENFARSTKEGKITVEAKLIGDRPAGSTDAKTDLVQFAKAARSRPTATSRSTSGARPTPTCR